MERNSRDADITIIEGVMGYFDGKNPLENTGSAADIADITESPVLLVVDCASMARSAAAIVKGFQTNTCTITYCWRNSQSCWK